MYKNKFFQNSSTIIKFHKIFKDKNDNLTRENNEGISFIYLFIFSSFFDQDTRSWSLIFLFFYLFIYFYFPPIRCATSRVAMLLHQVAYRLAAFRFRDYLLFIRSFEHSLS